MIKPEEVWCCELLFDFYESLDDLDASAEFDCFCPLVAWDEYDKETMAHYNMVTEEEAWKDAEGYPEGTYLRVMGMKHGALVYEQDTWMLDGATGFCCSVYQMRNGEWVEVD